MKKLKVICSMLMCTAIITGCGSKDLSGDNSIATAETTASVTTTAVPTEPPMVTVETLPMYWQINVSPVLQEPELPTGCEITSLTALLNYRGYMVDKMVMADTYLDCALENGTNYTFYEKYIGDPRTNGYGCYSPVIVKAATEFLADQNSPMEAVNLSGSTMEEILMVIASGHPVVIWNTLDSGDVEEKLIWTTPDGEDVYWTAQEHCMLLTGFNLAESTVTVCDPMKGIATYELNQFFKVYDAMHQQAMTVY